jgi:hypothetical protein
MAYSGHPRRQSGGIRLVVVALLVVVAGDLIGLAVVDGSKGPTAGALSSDSADEPTLGAIADAGGGLATPSTTAAAPSSRNGTGRSTTTTTSAATTATTMLPDAGWDFPLALEPRCAAVGQLITVTMQLEPGMGGSLVAVYADGDYHGTMHAGQAEPDGRLVYRWPAPPAPGEALLLVTAGGGPEKKAGRKTRPFRIVTKAGECRSNG